MADTKSITVEVMNVLQRHSPCEFDQLAAACSEYSWSQVFLEVDRLNRLGEVCLSPLGDGHYLLTLAPKAERRGNDESGE